LLSTGIKKLVVKSIDVSHGEKSHEIKLQELKRVPTINRKPVHHNYLKDLRTSKVLARDSSNWSSIIQNPGLAFCVLKKIEFNAVDKYETMLSELEKLDVVNARNDAKIRCGVTAYRYFFFLVRIL
jgi:hypothetical protein